MKTRAFVPIALWVAAGCSGSSGTHDGSAGNPGDASSVVSSDLAGADLSGVDLTSVGDTDGGALVDLATKDGTTSGTGYCATAKNAVFCDDFTDSAKTMKQFVSSADSKSSVTVSATNAVLYKKGPTAHIHLDAAAGSHAYLTGKLASGMTTLYGRMRLYVAPIGTASGYPMPHGDFFQAQSTDGDYAMSCQYEQISSVSSPEVGGNHYESPYCTGGATACASTPWPSGQWMCLEWEYTNTDMDIYNDKKGGTNQIYWAYVEGSPAKSVLLSDQYGNETQFPILKNPFTSVQLGGGLFGDGTSQGTAFDYYYTNFAIGTARFNDCASDE